MRNVTHRIWYALSKHLAQVLFVCLFRVRVSGRINIPVSGGALLASNHQSFLDPVLIGLAVRREVHFMAKHDLFEIPVFGPLIRSLNAFPVTREGADRRGIREAVRHVTSGGLVVVFPEGTRVDSGSLGEVMPGTAFIGKRARCPVIPVAIYGAHRAWPTRYMMFHCAPVKVAFGRPMRFKGADTEEMTKEIAGGIENLLRHMV